MTGGRVCNSHGGLAPQVRAAAERRWALERRNRRIARQIERELGRPLDPVAEAFIWYRFSADPATWRRHVRTRPGEAAG